jgi:hypothetical protein
VVPKWEGPGQILATSTMFDDPQNSIFKGRSKRGGRGGRPSHKLKVPEGTYFVPIFFCFLFLNKKEVLMILNIFQ